MGSKAFLILGLFLAIFVMISSEVLARELAKTSTTIEQEYPIGYPGANNPYPGSCQYGCCRPGTYACYGCCEAKDKVTEGKPHN